LRALTDHTGVRSGVRIRYAPLDVEFAGFLDQKTHFFDRNGIGALLDFACPTDARASEMIHCAGERKPASLPQETEDATKT